MKTRLLSAGLLIATCTFAAESDRAGLQPGTLAEPWVSGGPNCVTVPNWEVHEYNEDFYILRESGCVNASEKPFLYLIFGGDRVLLEDVAHEAGAVERARRGPAEHVADTEVLARGADQRVAIDDAVHGDRARQSAGRLCGRAGGSHEQDRPSP